MRAIEKLRDEAVRNGNVNWDTGHVILADYVQDTLLQSGLFDEPTIEQIQQDIARVLDADHPETSDVPFDRLTDRVVEWTRAHPDPVPHTQSRFAQVAVAAGGRPTSPFSRHPVVLPVWTFDVRLLSVVAQAAAID